MKTNDITLSAEAITAINGLQHNCGTYRFYSDTLSRLYNLVFFQGDEFGMDDTEILHTLRALVSLKADLAYIASHDHTSDSCEDTAAKVEAAFAFLDDDGGDTPESPTPISQEGEPREMLADVKRALEKVHELQTVISEAITHAQNAGEKYESVISDLADVNGDLETTAAALDAVMAIDPDNYEPKELTEAEQAALLVQRSRDALTYGKELLDDALDHAVRDDYKALSRMVSSVRELTATTVNAVAELVVKVGCLNSKNE